MAKIPEIWRGNAAKISEIWKGDVAKISETWVQILDEFN